MATLHTNPRALAGVQGWDSARAHACLTNRCLPAPRAANTTSRVIARRRQGPTTRATAQTDQTTAAAPAPTSPQPAFDIQERVEFLRADLTHLFDDVGIDASAYDAVVEFRDPITRYSSLQGYLFNIQLLRRMFSPKFELHDIRALGPHAIISRWTMTMDFTPAKLLPSAGLWSPQLIFTGTSIYGFNPANGKINRHIDTWDSINNQDFFSIEAFADFWRQLLATYSIPNLETPDYTVLRRAADYQIRQYKPYLVARTPLDAARSGRQGAPSFNPAGAGFQAFNTLARFIFGGNAAGQKMEMTTPVFTDTQGEMQFVIGPSAHKEVSTVPQPLPGAQVSASVEPGGVFAVRVFGGLAMEGEVQKEADALLESLQRDGVVVREGAGWKLARYNDPGTLPPFRRNEVLVELAEPYELWRAGELDTLAAKAGVAN